MGATGVTEESGSNPDSRASRGGRRLLLVGVAVAVALIIIAGTFLWVVLLHPSSTPGVPPIQGPGFAVSPPAEIDSGGHHWYNFSVQSAITGIELQNLVFQVQTPNGGVIPAAAGWTLQILGTSGGGLGGYTYSALNESWTSSSTTAVTSGDTISLDSGLSVLGGDNFLILGAGAYQGSISVAIP
jgi:hypothetical protein